MYIDNNERKTIVKCINKECEKFLRKIECHKCPLYKNGLCDKIFNDKDATDKELIKAYNLLSDANVSSTTNAWDIIRNISTTEYDNFKRFIFGGNGYIDYDIHDFMKEFSNDEFMLKYREFKGEEE